ncbi:MAG: arylsulfatase [Burkholderiaceae bacterium]|nr:arylsulfatase [Burkholderiaceae bacterium]
MPTHLSRLPLLGLSGLTSLGGLLLANAQAQESLPFPPTPTASTTGKTLADSKHQWRTPESHLPADAPNILVIMLDDVGFAHSDTVGGPVHTPTLQRIMDSGIRYNAFHTSAISSATRAALLTGRNPHHVGFGGITETASDFDGYVGKIPKSAVTVAEVLQQYGYSTSAWGKWHNTPPNEVLPGGPYDDWPTHEGFDHFYGFMAAESSQYEPRLFNDVTPIEPPHDPKYHLSEDLADKAVGWLKQHHTYSNKPFFMYWAPGAIHAPHQIFKEWADKYKGKFDGGWDQLRAQNFERQKALGWIPQDTVQNPRPATLPAWDSLSADEKKFHAREMEVVAGFLEHADTQAGRIVDELEHEGLRDNTLIFYVLSDNGASAEGIQGSINEMLTVNGIPMPVSKQIDVLNKDYGGLSALGGPKLEEHYSAAWAWAAESPFQGTKLVAGYFGGTRTPLAVSWPKGIKADPTIRTQLQDVDDIVPTIYDVLHITPPKSVNGVEQIPLDGMSLRYTFADAHAAPQKHEQYFETFGSRAMYQDGWIASVFGPRIPWIPDWSYFRNWDPNKDHWALYDLSHDYSQSTDLSDKYPEKVEELKAAFDKAAKENNVYPVGAGLYVILHPEERIAVRRTEWHFDQSNQRLPDFAAPRIGSRNNLVSIDVDVPAKASGVLYADGGMAGGISVYFDQGRLHYEYNTAAVMRTKLASVAVIKPGHHKIEVETRITAPKVAAPADITLRVDGKDVAKGTVPMTETLAFSFSDTFDVGMDLGSPVSLDYFDRAPFKFNGHIGDVHVEYKQ